MNKLFKFILLIPFALSLTANAQSIFENTELKSRSSQIATQFKKFNSSSTQFQKWISSAAWQSSNTCSHYYTNKDIRIGHEISGLYLDKYFSDIKLNSFHLQSNLPEFCLALIQEGFSIQCNGIPVTLDSLLHSQSNVYLAVSCKLNRKDDRNLIYVFNTSEIEINKNALKGIRYIPEVSSKIFKFSIINPNLTPKELHFTLKNSSISFQSNIIYN